MPSGSFYCFDDRCGIHFWSVHSHDSIWHLALSSASFNSIPFQIPTLSGHVLTGYNILLDIIVYLLSLTGLSGLFIFFKIIPLIWFAAFTYLGIKVSRIMHNDAIFSAVLLFFFYFAGSFGYILTLYHHNTLAQSGNILAMQSGNMLTNLQLALSFVGILGMIFVLMRNYFSWRSTFLMCGLIFLGIGIKFYGGVISIFIIILYLMNRFISHKDILTITKHFFLLLITMLVAVIVFYNPFETMSSGSILIFSPFALMHAMIEEPDLVYLKDMVNARYFLYENGGFSLKLIAIELFSLLLFLIFNFGARIIGFMYLLYKLYKFQAKKYHIYVLLIIIFSTSLSVFFIQKGVWWNTVQFFYYAIFLSNIFAAEVIFILFKKKKLLNIFVGILLLISLLPVNYDYLMSTLSSNSAYISTQEIEALEYLKKQQDGIVFSSFHFANDNSKNGFDDTAYIPAFSRKLVYLDNITQLKLLSLSYEDRLARIGLNDCTVFQEVDYVYFKKIHSDQYLRACELVLKKSFTQSFENEVVRIYSKIK